MNVIPLGKPTDLAKLGRAIIREGYPVFPIAADKSPLDSVLSRSDVLDCIASPSQEAEDGQGGLYLYTRDPKDVTKLAKLAGCAGWAVPTGAISGVTAIDFDTYKDSPDLKAVLEDLEADLADTRSHVTVRGGTHYIFKGDGIKSKNGVIDGLDVKGEGGYVVWPPTPGYKVQNSAEPLPVPDAISALVRQRSSVMKAMTIDSHLLEISRGAAIHENALQVSIKGAKLRMDPLALQERVIKAAKLAVTKGARSQKRLDALLKGELDRCFNWADGHVADDTEELDLKPIPFADAPQEPQDGPEGPLEAPHGSWVGDMRERRYEDDLIDDMLRLKSITLFYGDPGAGKSYVIADMCSAIARGADWFGRFTRKRPVLYIAAEAGDVVEDRAIAYCRAHGVSRDDLDMRIYSGPFRLTYDVDERPFADNEELMQELRLRKWGVIVIDTLVQAAAGYNLSSQEEIGKVWRCLTALQRTFNACIILVHHSNRSNTGHLGSQTILGNCDAEFEVEKADEASGTPAAIRFGKQRRIDGGQKIHFALGNSQRIGVKVRPDGTEVPLHMPVVIQAKEVVTEDMQLVRKLQDETLKEANNQLSLPEGVVPQICLFSGVENTGLEKRQITNKSLLASFWDKRQLLAEKEYKKWSSDRKAEFWKAFIEHDDIMKKGTAKNWRELLVYVPL